MKKPTDLGTNRTGIQASPFDSKKSEESGTGPVMPIESGGAESLAAERTHWSRQADPVGTMPLPLSAKGMVTSAVEALKGDSPTVFLDKLGERLAYERTGVRLYEALLAKLPASDLHEGGPDVEEVRRIRDDELRHFVELKGAMETLGADPTAITPCADVVAVASGGIVKVLTDPRTTLSQCLEALLMVELMDNDGWVMLIQLAEGYGKQEMADLFRRALADEDRHLAQVREWVQRGVAGQAGLAPTPERGEQRGARHA
jgi:hypothetical protein